MPEDKKHETIIQIVAAHLMDEVYGIPIMQVQEIIKIPDITHIPNMPDFIEGVINLRGKIVPIIDLHRRFNLEKVAASEDTRIVVAFVDNQLVGLVVDSVSEVIRLSEDVIDPVPPTISRIGAEYLSGVGKVNSKLIIILNLPRILTDLEKVTLRRMDVEKDNGSDEKRENLAAAIQKAVEENLKNLKKG